MALLGVNTGLRDSNVCGLEWQWEVRVPEVGRSVFVIPPIRTSAEWPAESATLIVPVTPFVERTPTKRPFDPVRSSEVSTTPPTHSLPTAAA
jgi:hypothetical protein